MAEEFWVEFEADEEEEKDDADLGKGVEVLDGGFWEDGVESRGEKEAEEAGPEHDSGNHFAHDLGLSEADEEESHHPAESEHQNDLNDEEEDETRGGHGIREAI